MLKIIHRLPAGCCASQSQTYTASSCIRRLVSTGHMGIWKYMTSVPPRRLMSDGVGQISLGHNHGSIRRMFTFRINKKNPTWHRSRSCGVLWANQDRVFIISALVPCLSCMTSLLPSLPQQKIPPLTNSLFSECPLSHIIPASLSPRTHRP